MFSQRPQPSHRQVSNVLVIGDSAGVIQWANSGWRELIGLPLHESAGKPIGSVLDRFEVDASVIAFASRKFLSGEVCEVEFPFADPGGRQRWLQVRVSPTRDRDGEVTRFIAIANEITDRVGAEKTELDECDLSSLLAESARALAPELGSRTAFDAALCEDLPPALADPARLTALLRHLIRHAARTIDDEWGTISLTTGLVGLGEEPIGNGYLAAGMPMGPYLFAEVHDTGLTSLTEAWARLNDPFLPGCGKRGGVRFPNALQLVQELGGRIDFHHDEPFGTSIAIVLPA